MVNPLVFTPLVVEKPPENFAKVTGNHHPKDPKSIFWQMGHGQYLVYGSKSSTFSDCIIIFQILGNHVFTPCIPGSFQRILMVFHRMVSPSDGVTTRHFGVYSKSPAFIAKTQTHANFLCASSARSAHQYARKSDSSDTAASQGKTFKSRCIFFFRLVGGRWPVACGGIVADGFQWLVVASSGWWQVSG